MNGYDYIKSLKEGARKKGIKVNVTDLLVLANQNDPFYAGQPSQIKQAEWFAGLWERFGFSHGVHLRRIHYRLVSQKEPIIGFNGLPYQNTIEDWQDLTKAAKAARYLGMVPADAFEDHRNPDPYLNIEHEPEPELYVDIDIPEKWRLPTISAEIGADIDISFPEAMAYGYQYRDCDQPYHLEVWIEKSTMNDILLPVCQRYGVNLVTSVGFQSITSTINLINRAYHSGKPARIFYISDFDPAGDFMPQAVARQIEYWIKHYDLNVDIALHPLALTRQQVIDLKLPRIPVKESDRRKANFEDSYGQGAVELDALESLYPGYLGRILVDAIEPYRDLDIESCLGETEKDADEVAGREWSEYIKEDRAKAESVIDSAKAICKNYHERLQSLKVSLDEELEPLQEQLDSLWQAVKEKADDFVVDLPSRPQSDISPPNEDQWLFDSKRDYFKQLGVYKARRSAGGGI